jgi:two-component system alkaline phosphatase synthesis response regulator PhoP
MRATVLVVDDEPDVRVLCKVNLEFEGYRVLEAGDGEAAIEMANREAPDLILLDLMMPHVNGWDVMKRLKEDEKTANIPIVLLTAMADEASQMRGWEQGVLDYVTKPFNPLSLSKYVQAALGPRDEEMESKRREQIIAKLRNMRDSREN